MNQPPHLVKPWSLAPLLMLLLGSFWGLQAQTATVIIDATNIIRTVDERVFGFNTAVWDGDFNNSRTIPLMQDIDVRVLRFPGGSLSDTYNWQTRAGWNASWNPSFDDFARVARTINSQVYITVNYGSGTAQLAADWVRYSNLTKGYGFKYWEIGNECYGSWENDTHAIGLQWDPVTYANTAKAYAAAMKAVDPTIKIGVVVNQATNEDDLDSKSPIHNVTNPRTGVSHHGWTPVMLTTMKSIGFIPDFVIFHRYDGAPGRESDSVLLQAALTWPNDATALRQQLSDYLGVADGSTVEIVCTENNSVYGDPGKQIVSIVNGLYMADSTANLMQTEFNAMVWWDFRNGQDTTKNNSDSLYGWRKYGDYGIVAGTGAADHPGEPYPTYYIAKLLSHFARGSDKVVKVTTSNPLLSAYAVKSSHGTLNVLAINKSPTATTATSFNITGFALAGIANIYSYGIPQDDSARTKAGSPDITQLNFITLTGNASSFSAVIGPYSAIVYELYPTTPPAPAAPVGYASGPTELTLTWESSAVLGGYQLERATSSDFTQGYASVSGSDRTSFVDKGLSPGSTYYYRLFRSNAGGNSGKSATLQLQTPTATGSGSSKLAAISTRAFCGTDNGVAIGGFVISGAPKKVFIQAVGPSLTAQGLGQSEILQDPMIEVHDALNGNAVIANNDDWSRNTNPSEITDTCKKVSATSLLPGDTSSAAAVLTLQPGVYSFIAKGKNRSTGIVLIEIYDADDAPTTATMADISARVYGRTGNDVPIGGLVIGGSAYKRVLVRAVGPTLVTQGLSATEVMQDPTIEVHDATHGNVIIATNDNWNDNANAADILTTGARIFASPFIFSDKASSALLLTLPPGAYSFVGRGKSGSSGIVLIEVYDAD